MLGVRSASNTKLVESKTITLHLYMPEKRIQVAFRVVNSLAVTVLIAMTFIGRFIKSFHVIKRKIIPQSSPPVRFLVVHEINSEAEKNTSDICRFNNQ